MQYSAFPNFQARSRKYLRNVLTLHSAIISMMANILE